MKKREQLKGPVRGGMRYGTTEDVARRMDAAYEGALAVIASARKASAFFDPEKDRRPRDAKGKVVRPVKNPRAKPEAEKPVRSRAPRPVHCEANGKTYPDIRTAAEDTFSLVTKIKDVSSLRTGISLCLAGRVPKTGGVVYRAPTKTELAEMPRFG